MGEGSESRSRVGRRLLLGAVVIVVLGVVAILVAPSLVSLARKAKDAVVGPRVTTTTLSPAEKAQLAQEQAEAKAVARVAGLVGVTLPARGGVPAPALPADAFPRALPSHQVVAYLPYWYLGDTTAAQLDDLTTVAYYALDLDADGSIRQSGPGWGDLQTPALASLVSAGHAAHDRVLVTVDSDDESVLDAISASPAAAAARLVPEIERVVETYGFDGVDLDLEGRAGGDRAGFARFVQLVGQALHAEDATWEVAIDTYPQSASDPDDFFDIAAIAPYVDQIFVMAYDMYQPGVPSANAPLTGASLSDATALETYTAIVKPSELVLGVPFYGQDWDVGSTTAPGSATGPDALPYSQIAAGNHAVLWDPTTDTVFINYTYQGKAHQAWFDDPLSLALKTALASEYHVAGVGMWALGMQGGSAGGDALLTALLGGSPALKLPLATPAH